MLSALAETRLRAVVIGGGATGCGAARDLILRGFHVTLVECDDLGSGTSSRFHGMLQSGARYAVSDIGYAAECMRERRVIADLVPDAVEPVGGLFVALDRDPPDFCERFHRGCQAAGIPVEELDPDDVMARECAISRAVARAFSVPDATINSWRLVNRLAADLRHRGGLLLTRTRVAAIETRGGRVCSVSINGPGDNQHLPADVVVNAAGPWSGRIASLVDAQVDLELTKGAIIVLAHRMVGRVVNRCRAPSSHDIMVPTGTVSLFGTTSEVVDDPDTTLVRPTEIQALLDGAEPLIPAIRDYRMLRAWAGVRPLVKPPGWPSNAPLSRRHKVIDHASEGIEGFFTICGGSLTTHRSMAEDLGNHICNRVGINEPCRTADTPLLPKDEATWWRPVANYERNEAEASFTAPVCECESVNGEQVSELVQADGVQVLHDLRRRLRIGFGPCQGTFCASRVAGLLSERFADYPAESELARFWAERLKGMVRTAWGEQARQVLLSDIVYRETLGLRYGKALDSLGERR